MTDILVGINNRLKRTRGYRWARFSRGYRVPNIIPSSTLRIAIIMIFSIFILGGGIYNIMEKPLAITPGPQQSWTFYIPYDINKQTLNESIIAMLLFVMGVAGYFVYYLSTRYVYSPRKAWVFALIGMSMLIIAFVGFQYSLNLKIPSG